jgi:hypothetical protein
LHLVGILFPHITLLFFFFLILFSSYLFNSHLSCRQFTHITKHTSVAITKYVCILEVGVLNFGWGTGNLALNFFPVAPGKCRTAPLQSHDCLLPVPYVMCSSLILEHRLYKLRCEQSREIKHNYVIVFIFLCLRQIHCSKHLTFKSRIKSHLPFAGIIRSSSYSPR